MRVNKKRIKPTYKLRSSDYIRIPPVYLPEKQEMGTVPSSLLRQLEEAIISEDEDIIFINKPSGLAVHGGSGVRYGLIESFRQLRSDLPFVELVHRIDKETSGIVMLAKNRQTLLELHQKMKEGGFNKYYQTLIKGEWRGGQRTIRNQLQRKQGRQQKVQVISSEDKGSVKAGKESISVFSPIEVYGGATLMKVKLLTGRMHQIRTQLSNEGYPVLGDSQYGDFERNREVKKSLGLKRLFLHAYHLRFTLNKSDKVYDCKIPLADDLERVINNLPKKSKGFN